MMWLGSVADTKKPLAVQDEDVTASWATDDRYLFQLVIDEAKGVTPPRRRARPPRIRARRGVAIRAMP
ncbi:MAG: hypothetical protein ACLTMP_07720 [Eggerthella lenta]